MPSSRVSQGLPGFPSAAVRTQASSSQTTRATNCANPGYQFPAGILKTPGLLAALRAGGNPLPILRIYSPKSRPKSGAKKIRFPVQKTDRLWYNKCRGLRPQTVYQKKAILCGCSSRLAPRCSRDSRPSWQSAASAGRIPPWPPLSEPSSCWPFPGGWSSSPAPSPAWGP